MPSTWWAGAHAGTSTRPPLARVVTQGGGSGVAFALVDAINKQADRDPNNAMLYLNYSAMDPGLTNDKCSFWHFRFYPSSECRSRA